MIIVNLTGGMGNQMFQYATAKRVSLKNNSILKLHFVDALFCTARGYKLDCFPLEEKFATNNEIRSMGYPTSLLGRLIFRLLKELKITHIFKKVISENSKYYDKNSLLTKRDQYIEGFWQNERYFIDIREDILKSFRFSKKISKKNSELLVKIKQSNSVSVHIRRGDYINNTKVKKIYTTLGDEYYKKAFKLINDSISNPTFFVFSDDIEWTKKNLFKDKDVVFVDNNNGKNEHEDMRLISKCKHNIISNSTFSWWGAWLNQNPNKIIIAPKEWFIDQKMNDNNPVSRGWTKI